MTAEGAAQFVDPLDVPPDPATPFQPRSGQRGSEQTPFETQDDGDVA